MTLTAEEREVIITYNNAERTWHVYCDSATMRGRIRKLARQIDVEPAPTGSHGGIEFDAPRDALNLVVRRRSRLSPEARATRMARARAALVSHRSKKAKTHALRGGPDGSGNAP